MASCIRRLGDTVEHLWLSKMPELHTAEYSHAAISTTRRSNAFAL